MTTVIALVLVIAIINIVLLVMAMGTRSDITRLSRSVQAVGRSVDWIAMYSRAAPAQPVPNQPVMTAPVATPPTVVQAPPKASTIQAPAAMPVTNQFNAPPAMPADAPVYRPWLSVPQTFAPSPAVPSPAARSAARPSMSMENLLGRNIVGIVASALVFVGLVFLGILVVPHLTNPVKITLMFALSAALTGVGYWLNARSANNFTKAVLGTGIGAFFISIMVTYLYFHALGDIVALTLLLVWTAAAMWLAHRANSLLVAVLAHVGMVTSVCVGYIGLDDNRLVLLLIYQFLSAAVIVGGNIWGFRATHRFGLYATLGLIVFSSAMMWARFGGNGTAFATGLPTALIVAAFLVQFVAGSFLTYLLFTSTLRLKTPVAQGLLQALTTGAWLALLTLDLGELVSELTAHATPITDICDRWCKDYDSVRNSTLTVLIVVYGLTIGLSLLRKRLRYSQVVHTVTVLMLVGFGVVMQMVHMRTLSTLGQTAIPDLLWLILPGLVLVAATRLGLPNQVLIVTGLGLVALDGVMMLGWGFGLMSDLNVVWSLVYLAALLGVALWARGGIGLKWLVGGDFRGWQLVMYLYAEASLARILFTQLDDSRLAFAWFAAVSAVALGVIHFVRQDKPLLAYRFSEFTLFTLISGFAAVLAVNAGPTSVSARALMVIACVVSLVILVERIRIVAGAHAMARTGSGAPVNDAAEYATAFAVTAIVLDLIVAANGPFSPAYPLSLICMGIALALIALGFWSWVKPLRLFGLVATIVCVLKLVTFDIANADTLMRVIAFIGGGVICFGISALYNFATKTLDATRAGLSAPVTPPTGPGPDDGAVTV